MYAVLKYALTLSADLRGTDRMRNIRCKDLQLCTVCISQQRADPLDIIGAAVHHGEQNAVNFELGLL